MRRMGSVPDPRSISHDPSAEMNFTPSKDFTSARDERSNLAGGFAHPQTLNDLPYFEHLEPPVSHRVPPGKIPQGNAIKKSKNAKASHYWPHLAANRLARSGRKLTGSIWPQIRWLILAATALALCARKFTHGNDLAKPFFCKDVVVLCRAIYYQH